MNDPSGFTKLVPGFDFLQTLVKNAGAAMPGIGQWVAPTIDPEELAKRIEELRTVQFWLEQNARMLGATIQAMEVQRMTLSTLKTMNVQMEDLRDSLKITIPTMASPAKPPAAAAPASPAPTPAVAEAATAAKPAAIDPLQWWGALARQFTELATQAMKDPGADPARASATSDSAGPAAAVDPAAASDARARPAKPAPARKTGAPR